MQPTQFSKTFKTALLASSLAALVTISACSMSPPKFMMDVQQGESFVLQQPVTIGAGRARVYIQHGQITGSGFDRYEPHCRLETRDLNPQGRTIQPDSFTISAVRIGEEAVAAKQTKTSDFMLAATGGFIGQAMANDSDNDSNRVPTMDFVHLYLQSDKQPNVLRLTCAGSLSDGDPFDEPRSHRPEREKINKILGEIGSIKIKP
ncbi:hypothetical protein J3998_09210 [Thiomicrorhabdus sp. 6S2-11]|uniref:Lipoprotein n=1 Tax=Thiomicrorhabdus marina TaxID=2818442 RepID=A0ABS3Q6I8_9GAMM|nr:hypothetical protein [Thiomicrorhabdus marina]MBO1927753.1 hypothetical protein [Thiomicrorhabdus marina]